MRKDEAIFVVVVLTGTLLLAFGAAELLARALQPVSVALMGG